MKRYFRVQLAMLVRQLADVIVVKDVTSSVDFYDLMNEAYELTDGTEFTEPDIEWGCDEGTHTFVGEVTEEEAMKSGLKKIELKKEKEKC